MCEARKPKEETPAFQIDSRGLQEAPGSVIEAAEREPAPGVFCVWHIATKENPLGTDCSAHLHDGRVFKCPYPSPADRLKAESPCSDYESNNEAPGPVVESVDPEPTPSNQRTYFLRSVEPGWGEGSNEDLLGDE